MLFAMLPARELFSQVFSPNIYQFDLPRGEEEFSEEENLPHLHIQLNGAFRETSEIAVDNEEKLNGSLVATIFKQGAWSFTLGYTLNKVKENEVNSNNSYFNSIIVPDFGGQAFSFNGEYFFKERGKMGINLNLALGLDKWIIDGTLQNATPGQLKILLAYYPLQGLELFNDNRFDIIIRGGLSGRFLTSDLSSKKTLLVDKFGTDQTSFWGAELNVNLLFNDLNLYFTPLWFFNDLNVDGFPSNGVFTIGAVLTGDVLKFQFRRK